MKPRRFGSTCEIRLSAKRPLHLAQRSFRNQVLSLSLISFLFLIFLVLLWFGGRLGSGFSRRNCRWSRRRFASRRRRFDNRSHCCSGNTWLGRWLGSRFSRRNCSRSRCRFAGRRGRGSGRFASRSSRRRGLGCWRQWRARLGRRLNSSRRSNHNVPW